MKRSAISVLATVLATLASSIVQTVAVANTLPKDIAWWIEAIPIHTLTISDQQFLNGDAAGKPEIGRASCRERV